MKTHEYLAADLGATSGRIIRGVVGDGTVAIREVHRFANDPLLWPSGMHWDLPAIHRNVVEGIRMADASPRSIGVDSWGVDYGLIDDAGAVLNLPFHYRDTRTAEIGRAHV